MFRLFTIITAITFLSFLSVSCICQSNIPVTKVSVHKFSDGNSIDFLHKFNHVFVDSPADLKNYKKFNRARKTQRIVNFSFLGIVGLTAMADLTLVEQCKYGDGSPFCFSGVFTLFISICSGLVMLISNAIIGPIKKKRKKRLLREYPNFHNQHMFGNFKIKGQTDNNIQGLSLVYSF